MVRKSAFLAVLVALVLPAGVLAQSELAFLIPSLFGPSGLIVESESVLPDGSTHSAHFNSDFQSQFTQFNIALGTQLAALPIPSTGSGFTYSFDSEAGVFARTSESFGPILAERAQTVGKKKLAFGVSYQYFSFDDIEGLELERVPAVFTHDDAAPGGRADVVTTVNSIDVSIGQFTTFVTYGLTDRLDLSIAVPLINTDLDVVSVATVQRLGTGDNLAVHFFDQGGGFGDTKRFSSSGSASGIGDVVVRLKGNVAQKEHRGVALGLDVRLPTGDEEDLLGTGAEGFKPFAAFSFAHKNFYPHINLGYQWNGDSVLAGDILSGQEGDLPDQFFWVVGADIAVSDHFTLALDVLGQHVIDSPQLTETTFVGLDPAATQFPDIRLEGDQSFNVTNAAIGAKFNPWGTLLVSVNVLLPLDDGGVRDDFTALVGLEYSR